MKTQDTHIDKLLAQNKKLNVLMTGLEFSVQTKITTIDEYIRDNIINMENIKSIVDKKRLLQEMFSFIQFKLQAPNQMDISVSINLFEKRIIYIDVPHSCMKEKEIYEFTTFWIGVVPKIRKISEFLKKLEETPNKVKRKRT